LTNSTILKPAGPVKLRFSAFSPVRLNGKCGSSGGGKMLGKLHGYKLFAIGRRPD
jgi:hypothetical protein